MKKDDERITGGDFGLMALITTPIAFLVASAICGVKLIPWW